MGQGPHPTSKPCETGAMARADPAPLASPNVRAAARGTRAHVWNDSCLDPCLPLRKCSHGMPSDSFPKEMATRWYEQLPSVFMSLDHKEKCFPAHVQQDNHIIPHHHQAAHLNEGVKAPEVSPLPREDTDIEVDGL